jgi:hypothetical protein
MYDFNHLAAGASAAGASAAADADGLYMLIEAERVTVTEPEYDDTGRFWFFLCGVVRGEPLSIPHVVGKQPDCRVLKPATLARTYRGGVIMELERRGFRVSHAPGEGAPR